MDDTARTTCIVGSSMSDDFFEDFLVENLEDNEVDEAMMYDFGPTAGITIQIGSSAVNKFMQGGVMKPEFRACLVFYLTQYANGKPDFPGIKAFLEEGLAVL